MERTRILLLAVVASLLAWSVLAAQVPSHAGTGQPSTLSALTSVAAVRQLSREEAERGQPVRVRATVTSHIRSAGYHVQDDTGPIFVFTPRWGGLDLEMGQVVELEGITNPGRHAPQINEISRRVVGSAPLPAPRKLTYDQLISGTEDGYYAEIEGVIRRVTVNPRDPRFQDMMLAMGEGRVDVLLFNRSASSLEHLVDAGVRLRGVVSGGLNDKRQWVRARFNVCRPSDIVVEQPAPSNPFAVAEQPMSALLRWNLRETRGHRVKVRGVVTHYSPGGFLFISDQAHGLEVRLRDPGAAQAGDVVEVLGFPGLGVYSAVLEDAVFRRVGRTAAPTPSPTTAEGLLHGNSDASLISVQGALLESVRRQGERTLVIQAGDVVFNARIDRPEADAFLDNLQTGTMLDLTGICMVAETTNDHSVLQPKAFSLLLRNPSDVVVLQRPPWWTADRLLRALTLVAAVALAILIWVWLLRRQVRTQAGILSEKTQREAVLGERARIAREFHDTLEADLTGVSLQLEAAAVEADGSPVGRQLQIAHRLLQRSQKEVRQSVWDLRRAGFGTRGFVDALEEGLRELSNGAPARIRFELRGEPQRLPTLIEHHLLRIAREAVTNALKHARPGEIRVEAVYAPGEVRLTIADDGCGFATEDAPGSQSGHFGLLGMHERAGKIGGQLSVTSRPGEGTRVEIIVPISNSSARPARI